MESDKKSSIRQKMEPNGSIFCRFLVTKIKEKNYYWDLSQNNMSSRARIVSCSTDTSC